MNRVILVILVTLLGLNLHACQQGLLKLHTSEADPNDVGCWVKAYGRGVGGPIHTCRKDLDKSGWLCYPKCQQGYTGVGPVCWQNCPANFRDDGAFCYKNKKAYGRGTGHFSKENCENKEHSECEKWGLLWYPKCISGFHNVACCICSADCEDGMTDIGISCAKKSYGRGAGYPLTCETEEDYYLGLCYEHKCKDNYSGIGPVCWQQCPAGYNKCGALCIKDESCVDKIKEYIEHIAKLVKDIASGSTVEVILDIAQIANDYLFPNCPDKDTDSMFRKIK